MNAFLYFLFWAVVIFLMMRLLFLYGSHIMGYGHGLSNAGTSRESKPSGVKPPRWTPPAHDVDPVCGKTVDTGSAKSSVYDGSVYYFCSRECRKIFEAASRLYIGPQAEKPLPQLENKHV